ncbi:DsrE family protein [Terasakiella sp. A23]|uniref:DsrE family protein n=1 Tax=Terasakiella sp. FCG-A23 TaxID=3080561 RepID=UPI0029555AB9|nr:DsrE family protein [Terasakiella sp. A23]MDV7340911.1 DsrE family protein [Terasakiella sp. A23]
MTFFLRCLLFGLFVLGLSNPLLAQERSPGLEDDTKIVEPEPDWDNPRRIVLQVTTKDEFHVNNVYYNAINLQKFYGADNVKIAIVFYGPGIRPILSESAISPDRVKSLQNYEIDFIACNNTMTTIGKRPKDLLPGIRVVTSGIAEIIEKKTEGWHYIIP